MIVFDYLNELAEAGTLGRLVQAGIVTSRAYGYREIYRQYQALAAAPQYAERPDELARVCADECRVDRATIYRALGAMRRDVGSTAIVAK